MKILINTIIFVLAKSYCQTLNFIPESDLKFLCSSINFTADPCEDFYEYACGNWVSSHTIPKGEDEVQSLFNQISVFSQLSEEIGTTIQSILQETDSWMNLSDSHAPITKARSFFRSCMDIKQIETLSLQPMIDYMKMLDIPSFCDQIPIGSTRDPNYENWSVYESLKFTQTNFFSSTAFFDIDAVNDYQKSGVRIIKIEDSGFSLQQEIYTSSTNFPWLEHLKSVFNDSTINGNYTIFISSLSRLYFIVNIINTTPKIILANYILWHNIRDRIIYLGEKFRKLHDHFRSEISFNDAKKSETETIDFRIKYCAELSNNYFGLAIAGDFVGKTFGVESLKKATNLLNQILENMKQRIQNNDWLDQKTITNAIHKLNALSAKVGYPEYIFNISYLEQRYKTVEMNDREFFLNVVKLDKMYRKKYLEKLHRPFEKDKWSMLPQTVNAMYQFFNNDIIIPSGILRPPFFYSDNKLPLSLNYGAIGSVIGHEITHAFDSTGRKFDENGTIVKEWWSGGAVKQFNQRAICFNEQYSQYKPNQNGSINGAQTLAENIADNGGLLVALEAFESLGLENQKFMIKGHSYTCKQLFFIAFAQGYCGKSFKEFDEIELLIQSHSPSKYRVIGTLSNVEEFSKEFNCKTGRMNNEKKCKIW
ncbi:Endothelin-converting enzyme 2 [Thelohanellus kitauei]|uniref:Endothelin-converting enzyme 2 n=1 Tax=Thelohanellus kitauei TaxID=669202 RepID=A0A0C2I6S6_THEKT|nr:Endothelin-converting enzyme 2 [Thelohanellus kitauei]